jgi:hypothetical protein
MVGATRLWSCCPRVEGPRRPPARVVNRAVEMLWGPCLAADASLDHHWGRCSRKRYSVQSQESPFSLMGLGRRPIMLPAANSNHTPEPSSSGAAFGVSMRLH